MQREVVGVAYGGGADAYAKPIQLMALSRQRRMVEAKELEGAATMLGPMGLQAGTGCGAIGWRLAGEGCWLQARSALGKALGKCTKEHP